jgi:uncharacterized membrane protein YoaK (UPF0700 family)
LANTKSRFFLMGGDRFRYIDSRAAAVAPGDLTDSYLVTMPIEYARGLTGKNRTTEANRHLGFTLAFVAGATNAGGFLAVHQYTSHMTGIVSAMADNVALGVYVPVLAGMAAVFSFLAGAACSAVMVNYARRRRMHSEYALPLLFEAVLLLGFGVLGAQLAGNSRYLVSSAVLLLCFLMGLQNAVITKLSSAEIRTTHITGIVTDIGIELGKLVYWNVSESQPKVLANRDRLKVLTLLVVFFFVGGVTGAVGFKRAGYIAAVPLALILMILASVPAVDDITMLLRRSSRYRQE